MPGEWKNAHKKFPINKGTIMKKVKVGVLGMGVMGKLNANALAALKNAEITAVCDRP